jgi:ABC-type sugar transport system substrate-binding protein
MMTAVLFLVSVFFTTGQAFAKKKIVIGKLPITLEAAYHQMVSYHAKNYAKKMYNAEVRVIDGQGDPDVMANAIDTFIAQKVDGILIHAPFDGFVVAAIQKAQKMGIPVSTTYVEPSLKVAPHIQQMEIPASFEMGRIAAMKWKEWYPNKTCYVAGIGWGNFPHVMRMRFNPFMEGVKSVDPKAKMLAKLPGNSSTEVAMNATLDMLAAHPEINIIQGGNDEHAMGALAAAEQLGRGKAVNGKCLTEIIVGTDGNEAAFLKIYDPTSAFKITMASPYDPTSAFKITMASPAKINAYAEVDNMMAMIEGKIDPKKWVEVITYNFPVSYWTTPANYVEYFLWDNMNSNVKLTK